MLYLKRPHRWEEFKRLLRHSLDEVGNVQVSTIGLLEACGVAHDNGHHTLLDLALHLYGHRPDDTPKWNSYDEFHEWLRKELAADVVRFTPWDMTLRFYREKRVVRVEERTPINFKDLTAESLMTVCVRTVETYKR